MVDNTVCQSYKNLILCVFKDFVFRDKTSLFKFAELKPVRLDCSSELHDHKTNLARKGKRE